MADGRHFVIMKAPYINEKLSNFDEVWCAEANSDKDGSMHFTKIQNFPNSKKKRRTSAIFIVVFWPEISTELTFWSNFV